MANNNSNGTSRALTPAPNAAMIPQINPVDSAALAILGESESNAPIVERAKQILLSRPANRKLSAPRAIAAALHEAEHPGKREGRDFHVDEKMGIVDSYQGLQKDAEARADFYARPRPMRGEEAEMHEIQPGDTGAIYEFYERDVAARNRAAGIPYDPLIGVGIVREAEKFQSTAWDDQAKRSYKLPRDKWGPPIDPPTGRSWYWKAQTRAFRDGLRRIPGMAAQLTAGQILELAEEEGLPMPPEGARLTRDQALAWVEQQRKERDERERQSALTPQERQQEAADLAARVEARHARIAAEHRPFDDPPAPDIPPADVIDADAHELPEDEPAGAPEDYDADSGFEGIPGAIEEREAAKSETVRQAEAVRDRIKSLIGASPVKSNSAVRGKMTLLNMFTEDRHGVLRFLFGLEDLENIPGPEAEALLTWRAAKKETVDGAETWVPSAQAVADARILAAAVRELSGQAPLFREG